MKQPELVTWLSAALQRFCNGRKPFVLSLRLWTKNLFFILFRLFIGLLLRAKSVLLKVLPCIEAHHDLQSSKHIEQPIIIFSH